jgi:membrane protein implicated in regulation of membrane protease activity
MHAMTPNPIYLGLLVYGAGALALSLLGALGQGHDAHDAAHDHDDSRGDGRGHAEGRAASAEGSVAAVERHRRGDGPTSAASRIASFLRSTVYLSLGAGATGLFAAARGLGALEGAAWAAGAGILALAVARIARRLVRRDLDSSFKAEEFLMEEGVIVVPAAPGEMGKAEVRKYGASVELYVRASESSAALAKGDRVRIVDCGDECYRVEPVRSAAGDREA